jgi:hypothetical protein
MTVPLHPMDGNSPPSIDNRKTITQLSLLGIRADELADRVRLGEIGFIDAVDMAYSAAQWSGVTESAGEDAVQKILAAAFGNIGRSSK